MGTNKITLDILEKEYQNTKPENFSNYVELVSSFILNKEIPFNYTNDEHHNLVALGNDYVFSNQETRDKLLEKVRNVTYEKLNEILIGCGLSEQERKMVFSNIYETAFLGCVTGGEAPLYIVLHFPVVPLVLHWTKGLFYTTKM